MQRLVSQRENLVILGKVFEYPRVYDDPLLSIVSGRCINLVNYELAFQQPFNSFTGFHIEPITVEKAQELLQLSIPSPDSTVPVAAAGMAIATFNSFTGFHLPQEINVIKDLNLLFQFLHRIPHVLTTTFGIRSAAFNSFTGFHERRVGPHIWTGGWPFNSFTGFHFRETTKPTK